jgi:hypothetical protein
MELAVGGWAQEPTGTFGYKALNANDILDVTFNPRLVSFGNKAEKPGCRPLLRNSPA